MDKIELKDLTAEEVWDALCIINSMEATPKESVAIEIATYSLQKLIKSLEAAERKREQSRNNYYIKMQDPEYVQKRRDKDKRYREAHKEQIREKNRKYIKENYTKEIR
jgi:hypothetical protein